LKEGGTVIDKSRARWRKSSRSGSTGQCVELGYTPERWRKSSHSGGSGACVELANTGLVRDSKNPAGPTLSVGLSGLVAAAKAGRLDR
jgi:hypothetical protein